jgi:peptidoglycan/LPS O-acetylase OafA/YrhL
MRHNYIKEIQSLRGISIILVFLFHLNQESFAYGFLGVDIFFVISGFVITKMIYENLLKNNFSIRLFYTSRFLRLLPSLLFMVLFVYLFIIATFQIHADPNASINTGIFSLFGLSNFYLIFLDNDYFNSFDQNTFEHTWSLSVEFQFYIFYPLFLIFLFKIFKNRAHYYIFFLALTLTAYILLNIFFKFEFFYHTGSRIGELFIGCLTYFLYQKKGSFSFYIFLLSIFFFISYFINQNIFYLIISICFLTSSVMLNIKKATSVRKMLNNKFFLTIGNASYSIYLWHLPIIFFTSILFTGIDYYFFTLVISFVLSFLSYEFVEKKFRKSLLIKSFFIKKIFTLKKFTVASFLVLLTLLYVDQTNSKNKIFEHLALFNNNISKKLMFIDFPEMHNRHNQICHENYNEMIFKPACFKGAGSTKLVYFFGDSSMLDFFYSFENFNTKSDKLFSSYNNSSFFKPTLTGYGKGSDLATSNLAKNLNLLTNKYDEIFLVVSFNHTLNYDRMNKSNKYFKNQKNVYIKLIKILPKNVKLIFIKDTPQFKYSARNCSIVQKVSFSLFDNDNGNSKCDHKKSDILKKMKNINQMFNNLKTNHNLTFLNLNDYFCKIKDCKFYNTNNFAKKFDGHHLTAEAAKDIEPFFNKSLNVTIKNYNKQLERPQE